jgi:hypothetical protein
MLEGSQGQNAEVPMSRRRALPIALAVSLALICVAAFAQGSRWREIANGDLRWDTRTVTRAKNTISVWVEGRFAGAEQGLEGRYKFEINCLEKKYANLEFGDLNDRGIPIVPSHRIPQDRIKWEDVVPETAMEIIVDDVCTTMKR